MIRDGQLLCVRKTRGPYAGLLDLPGGGPEAGESLAVALRRELVEELGCNEFALGEMALGEMLWRQFRVTQSAAGEPINLLHSAVVVDCQLSGELPSVHVISAIRPGGFGTR